MTSSAPLFKRPFVIFDLEFTAWEKSVPMRWMRPGEFKEVVQIGAVKVSADGLKSSATLDVLVQPLINRRLSPYFENLTGITNTDIHTKGVDFRAAYNAFIDFTGDANVAAFGRDDLVLADNIRLYGFSDLKPLPVFHDLRQHFHSQGMDISGMTSGDVAPSLGVPFVGRRHNALDDALSLAAAIKARHHPKAKN